MMPLSTLELTLTGLGVTQLPIWMVDKYLQSGELVQVLADYPCDSVTINVIYPQNRYVPLKVRCFVNFVQERLRGKYL